jgi:two-component system NtrC family sensor kinase
MFQFLGDVKLGSFRRASAKSTRRTRVKRIDGAKTRPAGQNSSVLSPHMSFSGQQRLSVERRILVKFNLYCIPTRTRRGTKVALKFRGLTIHPEGMTLQFASSTAIDSLYLPQAENGLEVELEERGRVLVVDDSATIRSLFTKALSGKYDCISASCYDEAVECLRDHPFDLVIADVIMPGLSGTELLRKIKSSNPEIAVIMVSGIDRPHRALDAMRQGAFDYLIKPCELPVLELAVERAFEQRTLRRTAESYKKTLESRNAELEAGKTRLQQLQTSIVQNEKMVALGQLAAGIAHELNNPVAFVHGNLDLLHQTTKALVEILKFYDSADLPQTVTDEAAAMKAAVPFLSSIDELDEIIGDCKDGATRIKDIVQNLRTFSRLDEADSKKMDVNGGIDSTVRLLSQYFGSGEIELVRDFGALPEIEAFGSQINQVWMNLLVNAAQAMGGHRGHISVTTRADDEFVTVTVADTGAGIPKQDLGRIFDPFYTSKPVGEGTGLGLSICFGIVKRHGGSITATSELGTGTAFTVRLPIRGIESAKAETAVTLWNN